MDRGAWQAVVAKNRTWQSTSTSMNPLLALSLVFSEIFCNYYYLCFPYVIPLESFRKTCHYLSQFSSVAQSCPTLCDPMDSSTPDIPVRHHPVRHQLPEFTQTHVHLVGDAIQPFHPLSSPSPPAFNLSQHQGLFKWVSSSHQVAKLLEFQLQHQSFQSIFRIDFHHPSSKASNLRHSAFFIVQLSHPYMTTGKTIAWLDGPLLTK